MDTVLAWHHQGLLRHVKEADAVVRAEWKDEWVSKPVRHLPTVPCRLLPRNVIMQARTRVKGDGSVEHYEKPRISQDSSDGAERSVNAGTAAATRLVELPTTQAMARGWAICDTAGTSAAEEEAGETPTRAVGYAIDDTSAYRYAEEEG